MKKLVILMTLILATSTAALANPIFEERGAKASNAVSQTNCCFDYNTEGGIDLTLQIWNFSDSDSDGDGILTLESTEIISTNQGQIISAIKSENKKPKFKTGAELSKTVNSMEVGDIDRDGIADILIGVDVIGDQLQVTGTEISKRSARTGPIRTEDFMNKAELIEAIASKSGLSRTDANKVVGEIILGEDRDMVIPGDREIDKKDIRRSEEGRKGLNAVNVKVLGILDEDDDGDGIGDEVSELARDHR